MHCTFVCLFSCHQGISFHYDLKVCLLLTKVFMTKPTKCSSGLHASDFRTTRQAHFHCDYNLIFCVSFRFHARFQPCLTFKSLPFVWWGGPLKSQFGFSTSPQDVIVYRCILTRSFLYLTKPNTPYFWYFINQIWAGECTERHFGCRESRESKYHGYL